MIVRRRKLLIALIRPFSSSGTKNELMDLPGSTLTPDQGLIIKNENPYELDESKKARYTTSTIKLYEKDATKLTIDAALKAKKDSEMITPNYRNIDTRVKHL
jgi:hypothetical protein